MLHPPTGEICPETDLDCAAIRKPEHPRGLSRHARESFLRAQPKEHACLIEGDPRLRSRRRARVRVRRHDEGDSMIPEGLDRGFLPLVEEIEGAGQENRGAPGFTHGAST